MSRGVDIVSAWERYAVQDPHGVPAAPASDLVFGAVRRACRAALERAGPVMIQTYGGDAPPPGTDAYHQWQRAFVPSEADRDFETWAARQSRPYLLHVSHLHQFSPELRQTVEQFAGGLFAQVGLPSGRLWTDCYAGDYPLTPFGVHIDGNSNFTFGLHGAKTLLLWEPEVYWEQWRQRGGFELGTPEAREQLTALATQLRVEPGRAIYWPSRYWHIAVPEPGLSVTTNIAAYWDDRPRSAAEAKRLNYAKHLDDPIALLDAFRGELTDDEITALVAATRPLLQRLLPRVAPAVDARPRPAGPRTLHGVQMDWSGDVAAMLARLRHRSSLGLGATPPSPPQSVPARVRLDQAVVWAANDDWILLASRGHAVATPRSPGLLQWLQSPRSTTLACEEVVSMFEGAEHEGSPVSGAELVHRLLRVHALLPADHGRAA